MKERWNDKKLTDFLQQETDKHRIYPSDKLWRNIQQELHGKKTWPALTIITLMVITALTISTVIYDHPTHIKFNTISVAQLTSTSNGIKKISKINSYFNNKSKAYLVESLKASIYYPIGENETNALLEKSNISVENDALESKPFEDVYQPTFEVAQYENLPKSILIKYIRIEAKQKEAQEEDLQVYALNKTEDINTPIPISTLPENSNKFQSSFKSKTKIFNSNSITSLSKNVHLKKVDDHLDTDDFITDLGYEKTVKFNQPKKASKFELGFYFTPSISYRNLVDDKTRNAFEPISAANGPISPIYTVDVNDVVRHKPALGTEIGIGLLYKISNKIKFKTGFQFNVRKYFIDSYKSGLNVASIAIIRNNRLDTISQYTNLSANGGYAETQLDSKLYQVSIPIGIQWQLLQLKRFGLNVAGTIQPTLTLNKNVYLISTDYKYYTDGTSFFRTWNLNTSVELNLTYKTGNFNWYLGPQLRYQHLPTYTEKYPVKEHRLDYGLKVGFTKQLFK